MLLPQKLQFFPLRRKLVSISMCIPEIRSLLSVDREIFSMDHFFHKQYGTFIPKRLPTSKSCCFKSIEAIELEPKRMEYFIFSAPEYFCQMYYYSYTSSQQTITVTIPKKCILVQSKKTLTQCILTVIPSLEGWPTKTKEAPSPHKVRLTPLDTNPVLQSLLKTSTP